MTDKLQKISIDICGMKPCFLNIIPGVTPIEEAIALLKTKTNLYNEAPLHSKYFAFDHITCKLAIVDGSPLVAGIEISMGWPNPQFRITLAEFVEQFGEPCVVMVSPPNATSPHTAGIAFEYSLIRILCQDISDNDSSIAEAPITLILLAGPQLVGRGMTPNPCESMHYPESERTYWQGFRSVNEYRRFVWGS